MMIKKILYIYSQCSLCVVLLIFFIGSLQEALDQNMLKSIEQLVSQAKSDTTPPIPIANKVVSPHTSPHKIVSLVFIYLFNFPFLCNYTLFYKIFLGRNG